MKCLPILPIVFSALSLSSLANQVDQTVEFSIQMMKQHNSIQRMSTCSGIDANILEQGYRKTLTHCLTIFGDNESKVEHCLQTKLSKNTGMTNSKMMDCSEQISPNETSLNELNKEIETLENSIAELEDADELSTAQQIALEAMQERIDNLYDKQMQLEDVAAYDNMSDTEKALEDVYRAIGDGDPTPLQNKQIEALLNKMKNERLERFKSLLK